MSSRIVIALGFALVCSSVVLAQAPQPLGGNAPPQQPPAGAPAQLFGGAAPADAATGDAAADNAFLDDMKSKKVIFKATVKGKQAALWVGEAFTSMTEEERTRVVRLAYKYLVVAADAKFKSPMTILLSDGQRIGPKLGIYTITPKGDMVKFAKPRAVAGPIGTVDQFGGGGGVPQCPACPPAGAFFCP